MFRILGLVADAQHRIARSGNKFGTYIIEDYTGKMEFPLFSEDYLKISPFLQQGSIVFITGYFKSRYNKDEFEFKLSTVSLAETLKKNLTKQVTIELHPQHINTEMIEFVEKNLRAYRGGNTALRFNVVEPRNKMRISLVTGSNSFEMNEELISYLADKPELGVQVITN